MFGRICGYVKDSDFVSNSHLNAQRANGIVSTAGSTVQAGLPSSVIPTKFAQFLISFHAVMVAEKVKSHERGIHLLQGLIALGEFALAVILLFYNKTCTYEDTSALCNATELLQYLYVATLLISWTSGEVVNNFSAPSPVAVEQNENQVQP